MRASRIPATIITGFLGSGKTTLLNHILGEPHDLRVAVLINEFGDVDIDSSLVVSADRDMVELSNGCICCSMNDGLIAALARLLAREVPFDHVVIETTGIADPVPVAGTFVRPEFSGRMRVDSILAVADAEYFSLERFDDPAARNQLRYADVVLLNKVDLVDTRRVEEVGTMIRGLNPGARILRTERSRVAIPLILGIGGDRAVWTLGDPPPQGQPPRHPYGASHSAVMSPSTRSASSGCSRDCLRVCFARRDSYTSQVSNRCTFSTLWAVASPSRKRRVSSAAPAWFSSGRNSTGMP